MDSRARIHDINKEMKKSYKLSEYSIIHGMICYGPDGQRTLIEAKPKIKVRAKLS